MMTVAIATPTGMMTECTQVAMSDMMHGLADHSGLSAKQPGRRTLAYGPRTDDQ